MKMKISTLRQVIAEAFTEHQIGIMKSMMQSALRNAEKFARVLQHGEGDRGEAISGLSSSAKELKGWAPVYGRHYPEKKAAAARVYEIVSELDHLAAKPFGGLFKGKIAKKAADLYKELAELCDREFDAKEYTEDYADTDDRHFSNKSNDVYIG